MVVKAKTIKFFDKTLTTFLRRQKPLSNIANPAFIKITKIAAASTQVEFNAPWTSSILKRLVGS